MTAIRTTHRPVTVARRVRGEILTTELDAHVTPSGRWAAHRPIINHEVAKSGWTTTHLPTGLGTGSRYANISDAKTMLALFEQLDTPILDAATTFGETPEGSKPELMELITVLRANTDKDTQYAKG